MYFQKTWKNEYSSMIYSTKVLSNCCQWRHWIALLSLVWHNIDVTIHPAQYFQNKNKYSVVSHYKSYKSVVLQAIVSIIRQSTFLLFFLCICQFTYLIRGIPTPPWRILYNLLSYNSWGCLALIDSNFTATSCKSKTQTNEKLLCTIRRTKQKREG